MQYNKSTWPFRENPWSSEVTCDKLLVNWTEGAYATCVTSIVLGFISAFILPGFLIMSVIINITLTTVLIASNRKTRSVIYFIGSSVSNILVSMAYGLFWYYLTKGLPYATSGDKYYFLLYQSESSCKFFRLWHSFSSNLMCNFLLCAAIDRFLIIYFPIKFSNLPNKFAWFAFAIVCLTSFLMTIPLAIVSYILVVRGKLHCWVQPDSVYLLFYSAIVTNMGPLQLFVTIILNIMFFINIRKQMTKMLTMKNTIVADRKQIHSLRFLIIFSASYAVFGVPQSVVYIMNRATIIGLISINADLCQNIGDIIWTLFLCRSLFDIVLSYFYFKPVREACLLVYSGFRKSRNNRSTISSTHQ
ncbi:rhodopsin-like orphan GPCR [Schistosoma japonicum]|uniref:Rhodopsin-like orphan GPCR n=1 Tax=Schistosoma japonicum TaxID=6182 RepID=A0A4Z2CQR8_SCHJA|nr:rhodopsin-like orphan GPCR [Schistosoma japonicum]